MLRAVGRHDVMVVAAYGLILPQAVLDLPRLGCPLGIRTSILPRWRSTAPIQRAILAGDAESGVTIMQMEAGLDTGPMRHVATTPIGTDDTASLHDHLMALGASAIVDVLADPDRYPPVVQPEAGVTYAQKLSKKKPDSTPGTASCRARPARARLLRSGPGWAAKP